MPKTALADEIDPQLVRRRDASARFVLEVNEILERRTELQGVLRLADLIHDGARWAA
jgi:hypothetical protein